MVAGSTGDETDGDETHGKGDMGENAEERVGGERVGELAGAGVHEEHGARARRADGEDFELLLTVASADADPLGVRAVAAFHVTTTEWAALTDVGTDL